ncbi:MAG: hypothetical protein Q8K58_03955, partial [Acidimicrobiales bacterium]|nr:hypothetical protein [Acidimicrobiales bacterium]
MAPRSPSLVWDSARLVEVLGGILVLTAVLVAAVGAVGGLAAWMVRGGGAPAGWRRQTRWWLRRRAARSFATAVAVGDFALAEMLSQRLLRGNDSACRAQSRSWDERILLECPWAEAAAQVDQLERLDRWFPIVRSRRADGTSDVLVGRHRRVHLRVVSEQFVPGQGVRFAADAGGSVLRGHLTLLSVPPAAS